MIQVRPFLTEDSPIEVRRWRVARAVSVVRVRAAEVRGALRAWKTLGALSSNDVLGHFSPALPPPPRKP